MADWPISARMAKMAVGDTQLNMTSTLVTAVSTGATAHVKSAWVEQFSETPFDAGAIILRAINHPDDDFLFDIALGSSGNETTIINNLFTCLGYDMGAPWSPYDYFFPISIPKGSRISMRAQCSDTNGNLGVQVMLLSCANRGNSYSKVYTQGANTTDTGGVQVDPGATANTKGSWSEIVSSTSADWRGFILAIGNQNNSSNSDVKGLLDFGIGGLGLEEIVIPNYSYTASTGTDRFAPVVSPFLPIPIPEGTRIAVRAQCDIIDAVDRLLDIILYGVA